MEVNSWVSPSIPFFRFSSVVPMAPSVRRSLRAWMASASEAALKSFATFLSPFSSASSEKPAYFLFAWD
jgi:hypothetical protein